MAKNPKIPVEEPVKYKPKNTKITVEQVEAALKQTNGNIAAAARLIGCSRFTVHTRINESPTLRQTIIDGKEAIIDHAESALRRAVLEGEGWAVMFTLRTVGKNRGYVEKKETELSGSGVTINLVTKDFKSKDGE